MIIEGALFITLLLIKILQSMTGWFRMIILRSLLMKLIQTATLLNITRATLMNSKLKRL